MDSQAIKEQQDNKMNVLERGNQDEIVLKLPTRGLEQNIQQMVEVTLERMMRKSIQRVSKCTMKIGKGHISKNNIDIEQWG